MPNFEVTGHVNGQRTINANEFGIVHAGATLTNFNDVVTASGSSFLSVLGSIVGVQGGGVRLQEYSSAQFVVGQSGTIQSMVSTAIFGTVTGTLSVQNAGFITGNFFAIDLLRPASGTGTGGLTLNNSGVISMGGSGGTTIRTASDLVATVRIANTGEILAGPFATAISVANGSLTVTNAGLIAGAVASGTGNDTIRNSGDILGNVVLGGGSNELRNEGAITRAVIGGSGADTIWNSGIISGTVNMDGGTNLLTNSGTIDGNVLAIEGADTVQNNGEINGFISLGGGINVVYNGGTITGSVTGASDADVVVNTGSILSTSANAMNLG